MDEFKVIAVMNEAMLQLLKSKNANYEKNLKIKNYLNDEAFFFKINKLNAIKILKNVGVKQEKLEEVYKKLTSLDVFNDLHNKGKIKLNDNNLVVKYKIYDRDDLFKKNKGGEI